MFGAVVNGDLSDEDRAAAKVDLGGGVGGGGGQDQNYTCPPLYVTGTTFDANLAVTGYGGAIASVEASLFLSNSSLVNTLGGAIYFGTSDNNGRDQLEVGQRGIPPVPFFLQRDVFAGGLLEEALNTRLGRKVSDRAVMTVPSTRLPRVSTVCVSCDGWNVRTRRDGRGYLPAFFSPRCFWIRVVFVPSPRSRLSL